MLINTGLEGHSEQDGPRLCEEEGYSQMKQPNKVKQTWTRSRGVVSRPQTSGLNPQAGSQSRWEGLGVRTPGPPSSASGSFPDRSPGDAQAATPEATR